MTENYTTGVALAAPNADAVSASNLLAAANTVRPRVGTEDTLVDDWRAPSAWQIATAAWRRETLIGQLASSSGVNFEADDPDSPPSQFNPWAYAKAQGYADLQPYLYKGFFDRVNSPEDFEKLAEFARQKIADLETLQKGGWGGAAIAMGASLFDVVTFAPMGWATKARTGSRLMNALMGGAAFGTIQAGQEAVMAQIDPTRTTTEALLNVGLVGGLGAGFGALAKPVAHPASHLHPANPKNPLNPDVAREDPLVVTRPGQLPEEGVIVERAPTSGDAGAARVRNEDIELAGGRVLRGAMRAIGISPDTRLWRYQSKAREALLKMLDTGNVLSRGEAKGQVIGPKVEDLAMDDRYRTGWLKEQIEVRWRQLNEEFGQSRQGTNLKDEALKVGLPDYNRIPQGFFMEAVRKRMVADDAALGQGLTGYGEQYRAWFAEQMKRLGVTDEAQVRTIETKVHEAADFTKTEFFDHFANRMVKAGMLDADELTKAYYPQMWNRDSIDEAANDFRAIMREWLAGRPADEWLAERGMDIDQFNKLDAAARDDLLREWAGDKEATRRAVAEERLEAAKTAYVASTEEAEVIAFGKKVVDREKKAASLNLVKAEQRRLEASYFGRRLGWLVGRIEKAESRIAALREKYPDIENLADDALETFRSSGDALDTAIERNLPTLQKRRAVEGEIKDLRDLRAALKMEPTPDSTAAAKRAEELRRVNQELRDLYSERRAAIEEFKTAQVEVREAAAQSRNANRWLDAVARKIDQHKDDLDLTESATGARRVLGDEEARIDQLRAKVAQAEEARRALVEEAKAIGKGLSLTRKELRLAAREFRKAKAYHKRVTAATPLEEYLDKLVSTLRGDEAMPLGFQAQDRIGESGRTQKRMFRLPPEVREKLESKDFLHSDLIETMDRYQGELAGRLALREVFGEDESLKGVIRGIEGEYDDLIAKASNQREADKLRREKMLAVDDIRGVRDRVLNRRRTGGDGADGAVWFAQKIREIAYIRFVGGFSLAALGDLATAGLASRGFFKNVATKQGAINRLLKDAQVNPDARELRLMLASFESAMHLSSSLQAYGAAAARAELGFGAGTTRRITSKIDRFMRTVAERSNVYSGQAFITDRVRYVAGIAQLDNIRQWVAKYDTLEPKYVADLASVGIDRPTARELHRLFEKHGTAGDDYFDPGLTKWKGEANGDEMVRRLRFAVHRTMRRASYMPGYGDTPLMMDNWMGALLLQFQSFAVKFTSEFMFAGAQRLSTVGDERIVSMMALAFALGYVNTEIRAHMRGDDTSTWSDAKWRSELLMRSGFLGWTQPYFDAGWKLAGDHINDFAGTTLLEPSSKYAQNSWVDSLLGPWLGTAKDLGAVGSALSQGDMEKLQQKALTFVPLNQQIRILGQTFEE